MEFFGNFFDKDETFTRAAIIFSGLNKSKSLEVYKQTFKPGRFQKQKKIKIWTYLQVATKI